MSGAQRLTFNPLRQMIAWEEGKLHKEETVELFQVLVANGMAMRLPGHYVRTARTLVRAGLVTPPKEDAVFYLRPKAKHSIGGRSGRGGRKSKSDPLLAVAYIRVSTDEQALGMEAQRMAITAWAERKGVTVARWWEDLGASGGADLDKRPVLVEALQSVRDQGAGLLLAHKADRIAREVYVAELVKRELRAAGASLALVEGIYGDDPFSEMAATVMDAAARLERRLIAARTKAALAVKKASGEKTGGDVPFGFRLMEDGVHLEPDEVEHPVLVRILELRLAGLGGRRIAATLVAEGHRPRGSGWNHGNVQVLADRLVADGMGNISPSR